MIDLAPVKRLASKLFGAIPQSEAKDQLRCVLYNRMQRAFRIAKQGDQWIVVKNGIEMKFVENPYHLFMTDADYLLRSQLRPGDTVIDAGAFVGVFTVYAAKLVGPAGHVFAFEPDPGTGERLRRHLELNGLTNVTLVPKGLWSSDTTLTFDAGNELGSSFVGTGGNGRKVEVPVTTIDAVMASAPVGGSVFVKMNIEGSEIEALEGALLTIGAHRPHWVIRTNHIVDGITTDGPVTRFLQRHGYEVDTVPLAELTTFATPAS